MKKYVQAASEASTITLKELCSGQEFQDRIMDMFWDDPESFGFTNLSSVTYSYGIWMEYGAIKGNDVVGLDSDSEMYVFKNGVKYANELLFSDGETYDKLLVDHPELEPELFDMGYGKPYGKEGIKYLLS